MQRYTVYSYLETALHVSGGTSTHHQERIQLYPQYLLFVTPLLLSAAIVKSPNNTSKWQMGFNSAFKGLKGLEEKRRPILIKARRLCLLRAHL
jgi:hypothetical protein